MKKICVIMGGVMPVPAVCGGAIETLVTSIAKKYSREDGFELTICSVHHSEAVKAAEKYPDVNFFWTHTRSIKNLFLHVLFLGIRMTTGKSIRPLQRHYNEISKLFQKEQFDLIIAEGGDTQAIVDIAKGYRREQFANHIHIHYLPPKHIAENYGHMIGISNFVIQEYLKVCHVPVQAHLLNNAIDLEKFQRTITEEDRGKIREKLGLSEQDFVVLYVGRIMEFKGVLELMQAVTALEDPRIKLLILGSANSGKWAYSSYENKIKKISRQNKERIIFTGYVENSMVYQYAAVADVQCMPTLVEEAAGLVLMEAMASGLPLIVTDSGGTKEYVNEDVAVIIDRENIVDHLKHAIVYLKDHPEKRLRMSEHAKRESMKYGEERYYRNFVKMINHITEENKAGMNGE